MAFVLDVSNNLVPRVWIGNTGYTSIANAMAAAAGGDIVQLSEGEFSEDVSLSQNNLIIIGAGEGLTVIKGQLSLNRKTNVVVQDLTVVDGTDNGIDDFASDTIIRNVTVSGDGGTGYSCMYIGAPTANTYNIYIDNCTLLNNGKGIFIVGNATYDLRNIQIRNTTIQDMNASGTNYGIQHQGDNDKPVEVYIFNTTISNTTLGLHFNNGGHLVVDGLLIEQCTNMGFSVSSVTDDAGFVQLTNSIIRNCTIGFLRDDVGGGTATLQIRNNQIYDNSSYDASTTVAIDMEYNWWGTDSPAGGQFNGSVDYTPWLLQPGASVHNAEKLDGSTSPSAIADAVWDEPLSGHATAGTAGKALTDVDGETDGVQAKLPTNFIMGSSDGSDQDDDIAAIKTKTDNLPSDPADQSQVEAAISASETAIRGADSDTLKTLSDEIAVVDGNVDTLVDLRDFGVFVPEKMNIPVSSPQLTAELAIDGTTANVQHTNGMRADGYIKIENEYIYYGGKTATTLTGLVRAKFGTSAAVHAVDTVVYETYIYHAWVRITGPDGKLASDPTTLPKLIIQNPEGTQIGSTEDLVKLIDGLYYHRIFVINTTVPQSQRYYFQLYHDDVLDSSLMKDVEFIDEPLSEKDYGQVRAAGTLYFDEDGYTQSDGTFVAWTDSMVGPIQDEYGSPVGGVRVVAFLDSNGSPLVNDYHPPFDNHIGGGTNASGEYDGFLPPGVYWFYFLKQDYQFDSVKRTITDS